MFRRNCLIQYAFLLLIFCAFSPALAQKTAVKENALTNFEKSIEQGRAAEVERDLLNYLIANPKDAKGFELLAKLRFQQNRFAEAKSLYQRTLMLDPNLIPARINLAIVNYQLGQIDEARSILNEISAASLDASVKLNFAQALILIGEFGKALAAIDKLPLKLKNSVALPLRAVCHLETGEKQKIAEMIPLVKKTVGQNPAIAIKFAEILSSAGMNREASDLLRSVITVAPKNADALILLAKSAVFNKDYAQAKIYLNRAAGLSAPSAELFFVRSLIESEQGNWLEAVDLLEKSLALAPNSIPVLTRFVLTAMKAREARKAVETAERLLNVNPQEPEFLYLFGAASLQNGNLRAAEESLERLMQLRPNDSRGCLALGLTLASQADKLEEARKQLNHCLQIDPANFEARYQLALSFKTHGETAKAIEYLEETIKYVPDYALALRDLGALYLQTGAEAKARIVLEKAVSLDPNDADTHFQLSRLYNLIGESALAKRHMEVFQKLKNQAVR